MTLLAPSAALVGGRGCAEVSGSGRNDPRCSSSQQTGAEVLYSVLRTHPFDDT